MRNDSNKLKDIYQASHNMLVASAKAVIIGHDINKEFKIRCMLSLAPIYTETCNLDDIILAQRDNRNNFVYIDVQVLGEYPRHLLNYFKNNSIEIKINEGDEAILKQYTSDFIVFSYYMSMVQSVHAERSEKVGGNVVTGVKNPYLPISELVWQVNPNGLRVSLIDLYDCYSKLLWIV